ncbi:MAG: hypothetical protein ACRCSK_06065 [Fusobacteriaceae bacterium]
MKSDSNAGKNIIKVADTISEEELAKLMKENPDAVIEKVKPVKDNSNPFINAFKGGGNKGGGHVKGNKGGFSAKTHKRKV